MLRWPAIQDPSDTIARSITTAKERRHSAPPPTGFLRQGLGFGSASSNP
jgi:hypothetical protein